MALRIGRVWWQIAGAVVLNIPFVGPNLYAWLTVPALNCYACPLAQGACPIGTIQHFLVIGAIPFLAIGVIGAFGAVAGRFYCSHLCPFGFFQDILGRLTKRKWRLPHWTGWLKYASLVLLVLIIPPLVNEPFFCTLCPAGTLEAGIPIVGGSWYELTFAGADIFSNAAGIMGMVGWWFWFKLALLGGMIALTLMVRRPFCRMACPLGAILGLFNRISLLVHPPRDKAESGRGYYLRECPVQITTPGDVDSHNCIKCRQCFHRPGEE